jgi:hypothetical protein
MQDLRSSRRWGFKQRSSGSLRRAVCKHTCGAWSLQMKLNIHLRKLPYQLLQSSLTAVLSLHLYSEDGRNKILRNVGILPQNHMASQPRSWRAYPLLAIYLICMKFIVVVVGLLPSQSRSYLIQFWATVTTYFRMSRCCSVSIMTRLRAGWPGFTSRQE